MTGAGSDSIARGMAPGTDRNSPYITCRTVRGHGMTGSGAGGGMAGAPAGKVIVHTILG